MSIFLLLLGLGTSQLPYLQPDVYYDLVLMPDTLVMLEQDASFFPAPKRLEQPRDDTSDGISLGIDSS